MLYEVLISPFVDFAFMRRALVAVIAVAIISGPLGVFLQLRRMSLINMAIDLMGRNGLIYSLNGLLPLINRIIVSIRCPSL